MLDALDSSNLKYDILLCMDAPVNCVMNMDEPYTEWAVHV